MKKIAVIMTSFNRRDTTLRCLRRLYDLSGDIKVYLVDDGSTDGTSAAVLSDFPDTFVIRGTGNLYWNRGMHLAWEHARCSQHEFFLWLNDDVVLRADFLDELMQCAISSENRAVISGIIDSHDQSTIIYGAADENKKILEPNGRMQNVVNMNGNVVLVPREIFEVIGNLDPVFHHDLGDVDYGLRVRANGYSVLTTRKVVGSCDVNGMCRVRLENSNIIKRFKKLYSPLGSHPGLNFYFRYRHRGLLNAFFYYMFLHGINFLPDLVVGFIFGGKYFSKRSQRLAKNVK